MAGVIDVAPRLAGCEPKLSALWVNRVDIVMSAIGLL